MRTPIDDRLKLIAEHRVMLGPLLGRKYHVRVLREKKLIRAHYGLFETRMAVYTLSVKGCRRANVSLSRSRLPGPEALAKRLALVVFRLTHPDYECWSKKRLARVLETEPPPGLHLEHKGTIYQVYVPGEDTGLRQIIRRLNQRIEEASYLIESWVEGGTYAFLVLADNESKANQLRKAVTDIEARVEVCVAPGPRTIPIALKGFTNGS
jgi:hypothetical protein